MKLAMKFEKVILLYMYIYIYICTKLETTPDSMNESRVAIIMHMKEQENGKKGKRKQ